MNLYDLLGVSSKSSFDELRREYHRLLLEYHPDKNSSSSSRERFESIQSAYRILSNVEQRRRYDEQLERERLHQLAHSHIDSDEYVCRCGTTFEIDDHDTIIDCPNCSMRMEIVK